MQQINPFQMFIPLYHFPNVKLLFKIHDGKNIPLHPISTIDFGFSQYSAWNFISLSLFLSLFFQCSIRTSKYSVHSLVDIYQTRWLDMTHPPMFTWIAREIQSQCIAISFWDFNTISHRRYFIVLQISISSISGLFVFL